MKSRSENVESEFINQLSKSPEFIIHDESAEVACLLASVVYIN
jgi:hypothetical protein